jgi:hypothetical protein
MRVMKCECAFRHNQRHRFWCCGKPILSFENRIPQQGSADFVIRHMHMLSNHIDSVYHLSSLQFKQGLNMASTSQQQVLVRVPDELAERWAQVVAPRQRSGYLIALLRRELDKESNDLILAAQP